MKWETPRARHRRVPWLGWHQSDFFLEQRRCHLGPAKKVDHSTAGWDMLDIGIGIRQKCAILLRDVSFSEIRGRIQANSGSELKPLVLSSIYAHTAKHMVRSCRPPSSRPQDFQDERRMPERKPIAWRWTPEASKTRPTWLTCPAVHDLFQYTLGDSGLNFEGNIAWVP